MGKVIKDGANEGANSLHSFLVDTCAYIILRCAFSHERVCHACLNLKYDHCTCIIEKVTVNINCKFITQYDVDSCTINFVQFDKYKRFLYDEESVNVSVCCVTVLQYTGMQN